MIEGKSITVAQWSVFFGVVTVAEQSPLNWGHPDEISGNMEAMAIHGSPDCHNGNIILNVKPAFI